MLQVSGRVNIYSQPEMSHIHPIHNIPFTLSQQPLRLWRTDDDGYSCVGVPIGINVRRMAEGLWDLVEMVYPGGIPADDLGLLLISTVHQNLLNDLLAPWECRLKMRIIRAP